MITITDRKRHKKNSMQGWLFWFALTAAFSLMGVGMASWQTGMDFGGEMGTAHIGVAFTDYLGSNIASSPPEDWEGTDSSASIVQKSDNELEIKINNAYPGLEVEFWYEIENTGSLPVKISEHNVTSSCNQVYVEHQISSSTLDVGGTASGDLKVEINNIDLLSLYTFSVQFKFEPDI